MLTRDHVVAEALAITSATDAAALSMRTLATRLGVVPAALDRHVRSKEQLYDVILDGALAGVDCQADPAPRTGQVTALAPGLPADLQPRHRLRPLIEVTRQPRPGTGSPRRSPGDTVRLTHPNLVHAGNASKRYGHAAAAALPGQWRHVEEAAKWPDAHACRSTGSARITSALAMTQRPCRTADLAPRYLNGDHLA